MVIFMLPQKLKVVIGELESLKPQFHRQLDELDKVNDSSQQYQYQIEGTNITPYVSKSPSSEWPVVNSKSSLGSENKLVRSQYSIYITHFFFKSFDNFLALLPFFCANVMHLQSSSTPHVSSWKQNNTSSQVWPSNLIDMQFQNL